jgi:hypothetical protein
MIKNKKLILINIFLIFFCSTYGNTFTLDDLKKNLEKGAKSLEQEINKQNNTESQKQQAQPEQQQAQPEQQQAQPEQQQAQSSPSNDLTIKETNFVNINHQEAVEYFNSMRGEIDKKRAQIESLGGLSGKQIFCEGRGNDRFGFYFMEGIPDTGRSYFNDDRQVALLYRFVPDPERNPMIDVGSRNVIHPALEIGSIQYYEDKEKNEINLSIEKINRETLDFYQVVNPLSGYNYKKVGKCEIFEGDLYIQFKKLSDNFDNYRKDQRKKQNEKNKL